VAGPSRTNVCASLCTRSTWPGAALVSKATQPLDAIAATPAVQLFVERALPT
jgi:hypothetical protein